MQIGVTTSYQYLTEVASDSNFNGAPSSSSTSNPRSMEGAKILISGGMQLRRRLHLEFSRGTFCF